MGLRDRIRAGVERRGGLRGLARAVLGGPGEPAPAGASPGSPEAPPRGVGAPVVGAPVAAVPPTEGPWVDVASAAEVREGHPGTYALGADRVAVFRVGAQLFAIDQTCVHEDGPLGEGHLEGHVVVCPYHNWRYDVRDGRCLTDSTRAVACFAVRERAGRLELGPRRSEGSADRGGEHNDGLKVIDR